MSTEDTSSNEEPPKEAPKVESKKSKAECEHPSNPTGKHDVVEHAGTNEKSCRYCGQ